MWSKPWCEICCRSPIKLETNPKLNYSLLKQHVHITGFLVSWKSAILFCNYIDPSQSVFCYIPKPRTYIWAICQMAQLGFFPNSYAAACFEPTSVELHQAGAFEGRSTNWATAPQLLVNKFCSSYFGLALVGLRLSSMTPLDSLFSMLSLL